VVMKIGKLCILLFRFQEHGNFEKKKLTLQT
jgi:hypothetical protein